MRNILNTVRKATASGNCYSGLCVAARTAGHDICIIAVDIEGVRVAWAKLMPNTPLNEGQVYAVSFFQSKDVK